MQYNVIHKYRIDAICKAPLYIGSAIGGKGEVLIHPVTNEPFIQSSSLAGVMRSISEKIADNKTNILFGEAKSRAEDEPFSESASRLRISDATFNMETVQLELRPRIAIDASTGTANSKDKAGSGITTGQKFDTEYIGESAKFSFDVYLYARDNSLCDQVEAIFSKMSSTQIGGMKTNGAGFNDENFVYRFIV